MPKYILELDTGSQNLDPDDLRKALAADGLPATVVTPTYIAILTQGGGCDYTIGCGVKVKTLRASSMEEAQVEVERLVEDYGGGSECRVDGATLYTVTRSCACDTQAIYEKVRAKQKAEEDADLEDEERAEFDRLSKKYGRP